MATHHYNKTDVKRALTAQQGGLEEGELTTTCDTVWILRFWCTRCTPHTCPNILFPYIVGTKFILADLVLVWGSNSLEIKEIILNVMVTVNTVLCLHWDNTCTHKLMRQQSDTQ